MEAACSFPNGTYNATIVFSVLGTSPITQSLIFTATNGKLVITSGNALPARIPAGAQLSIYDRGVIPPDFNLATPAPSPSASPTTQPTPSPAPSLTPTPSPSPTANNGAYGNPPPPAGQPIGTQSYTTLDGCPTGYLYSGYACSATYPISSNGGSDIQLFGFPAPGNNGQVYYVINNFSAVTYTIIGCDPPVQYSGGGASGTFTIPADTNPEGAHNSHVCAIELSTLPIGATGNYYGITLDLLGGGFHANAPTSGPFPVTTPSPGAKSSIRRTAR